MMSNEEKLCCVYKHTSPSGKVYIGVTSMKPEDRWHGGYGYKNNKYFYRAIKKYGWDNFTHEILFESLSKDDACQKEVELIALYDSTNPDKGYNLSTGGDGPAGVNFSDETRAKMSEAKLGEKNPMYGKPMSESTKQKLSEIHKKLWATEERRQKMALIRSGIKNRKPHQCSEETRAKLRESKLGEKNPNYGKSISEQQKEHLRQLVSKPVIQLTDKNIFVAEYPSAKEAAIATGCYRSNICMCCQDKLKHTGGFKWMYKEDYEKQFKNLNNND